MTEEKTDEEGYQDINVDEEEKLQQIHDFTDKYDKKIIQPDDGTNNYNINDEENPEETNQYGTGAMQRYRTEAEISKKQLKTFDDYRSSYGRHVALSNTLRKDNIRHLMALDLQYIYDDIPILSHMGTLIRIRETSEFQMARSNPEAGGFEAKLGVTLIKREDVDVKQAQSLINENGKKKKKGLLNFLRK